MDVAQATPEKVAAEDQTDSSYPAQQEEIADSDKLEGSTELGREGGKKPAFYMINFLPESSEIVPDERESLAEVALIIEQDLPDRIIIIGHTALVGTEEACLVLSQERAETVLNALLSLFVLDESVIVSRGAGASEPAADNSTLPGRKENRRVEIQLLYSDMRLE